MERSNNFRIFLAAGLLVFSSCGIRTLNARAVPDSVLDNYRLVNDYVDDNEACFRCHGESKYELTNEETGRIVTRHMCKDRMILRKEYYTANHKSFACLDCHSYEYKNFPHPLEPRLEKPFECIDCHGGDPAYASYHFEEIEREFKQSVHYLANPEGFTCWKCHPHSYHISIRNTENLEATIAYDNSICLSCHADFDEFELLTDRAGINIIQTHSWLPNQALHFSKVRCIECHTQINDSILVAHQVLPKEKAVRRCNECHSRNSLLMATLYKFQSKEARDEFGFLNAVVINNAYVIGANRNYFLNVISVVIFAMTFLGIVVHLLYRFKNKV